MNRGRDAVLSDETLADEGFDVKARSSWSREEWLAFQEGWSYARNGSPSKPTTGKHQAYFDVGVFEARHFAQAA